MVLVWGMAVLTELGVMVLFYLHGDYRLTGLLGGYQLTAGHFRGGGVTAFCTPSTAMAVVVEGSGGLLRRRSVGPHLLLSILILGLAAQWFRGRLSVDRWLAGRPPYRSYVRRASSYA